MFLGKAKRRVVVGALLTATAAVASSPVHAQAGVSTRLYGSVDYLLWWMKGAPLSVPLVSSGPAANFNGFLLNSNTNILYGAPFSPATGGNSTQDFSGFSGGRLTLGYVLDPARGIAVEGSGFGFGGQSVGFAAAQNLPTLGVGNGIRVPLFNTVPYNIGVPIDGMSTENGLPVAIPGVLGGHVQISNKLSLWGLEVAATYDLYRTPALTVTGLGGLQYLDLAEDFNLTDSFFGTSGPFVGQSGTVSDHFGSRNRFIGPSLGVRASTSLGPFSLTGTGKVAFGDMVQTIDISGAYNAVNFTTSSGPEGIFAQPTNSGTRTRNAFAVAPQIQVKLGYDVTPNLRLTIGYDFLYMNNVVRPTDQIDRNVPKGQIFRQGGTTISTSSPSRLFRTTDFYAQGLTAGATFRF